MYNNFLFNENLEMDENVKNELISSAYLFDETFQNTSHEIRQLELNWTDFPLISSREESFRIRMASVEKGVKERIDLLPQLKRFMKSFRPAYSYSKTPDGRYVFSTQFNDNIKFGIGFDRIHHMGLGKAFTLCLSIEHTDEALLGHVWIDNFFRIFGERGNWPPCYTYSIKDDLIGVFQSVEIVLNTILPIFEKNLNKFFQNSADIMPSYTEIAEQYDFKINNRTLRIKRKK